jgi:hypothetical protein
MNNHKEHLAKLRSNALVIAMVGKDHADQWWDTPNKAFDERTPVGMWVEDWQKVYLYLMNRGFQ